MNVLLQGAKARKAPEADNWMTPPHILEAVTDFYGPDWFDPCPSNAQFNGLFADWGDRSYINPPFSQYGVWAKAGSHKGGEQLWMCHHSHDTRWFKTLFERSSAMLLFRSRIRFVHPDSGKPEGTAIGKCQSLIYIGNRVPEFETIFQSFGPVLGTIDVEML